MLVEDREADDAAKLEALRAAAQMGAGALERGEFKEFADASALVAHLNANADAASYSSSDN
jgi:antitoxin ParD1/3/4